MRVLFCAALGVPSVGQLHIALEAAQPAGDVLIPENEGSALRWSQYLREDLGKGLPLQIDVGPRISHSGVQAGMPEPLADRGEVDSSLEQMDCRGVPDGMRVDPFAGQGRRNFGAGCDAFLEEVSDTKPGHRSAPAIEEDVLVGRIFAVGLLLLDQFLQKLRRAWPDRTQAYLVALADEPHLMGRLQANVADPKIDDLLDARPGVEHEREHGVVPPARRRLSIDAGQHSLDLRGLQVFDRSHTCAPLERDSEHLLEACHMLRGLGDQESGEGMQRG
jgi:hypothetical protein